MTRTIDIKAEQYLVQTRSQAKSSGVHVPEAYSADKGLILNMKPEHQKPVILPTTCSIPPACDTRPTHQAQSINQGLPTNVVPPLPKLRVGQGRDGIRRKPKPKIALPISNPIQTISPPVPKPAPRAVQPLAEPEAQSQERKLPQPHVTAASSPLVPPTPASIAQLAEPRVKHRPIPSYHELFLRPPPRPPDATSEKDNGKDLFNLDTDRNVDFEENSPYQEGIILKMYERPDKSYIQEPTELKDLIDTTKLIQKFLPKQVDTDKILDIIKRKVLKGTHLPLTINKIQAGYLQVLISKIFTFIWPRIDCPTRKVLYAGWKL